MNFTSRPRQFVTRVTGGWLHRTVPEVAILNSVTSAVAVAGLIRLAWQQELKNEEEDSPRGVGARDLGGDIDRYKRLGAATVTRLLVDMLPEWVRRGLWRTLRDRYSTSGTHAAAPQAPNKDDDVAIGFTA